MQAVTAARPLVAAPALCRTQLSSVKAFRAVPLVARPAAPASRSSALSQSIVVKAAAVAVADAPTEAVAHLRFIRGSAHKVRRVLDQIRGRSYEEAIMILEYMPYKACEPVLKTLLSAAANAKQNLGMRKAKLVVSECFADSGPVLKRAQPRAQGRAYKILKPMCHITIKVKETEA
ncbi:50S ribosomal L22 [Micractinium conductrix]|uniref:Large ribosomal subunit protein uL22c n=1 Tax=Micractinium conductrix TaxID=554055 RepID=A0A2P6VP81_9CHLO|nr:50S ribosomal L22 [Micractinium conductrix]|eukprot:PSC75869.1 50S ribosomal L22 [Micractinium conductrix]